MIEYNKFISSCRHNTYPLIVHKTIYLLHLLNFCEVTISSNLSSISSFLPKNQSLSFEKLPPEESFSNSFKLYKTIARECHPDKQDNEAKSFLFSNVDKDTDIVELVYTAYLADIEIQLTDDEYSCLQNKLLALENYISNRQTSGFFHWNSMNLSEKNGFISSLQ